MAAARIPAEEIAKRLKARSRSLFEGKLMQLLDCGPSDGAIVDLAERNPDRYYQSLAIVAKLYGYTDKLELEHSGEIAINSLSDAELMAELAALKGELPHRGNDHPANPS